MDEKVILKIDGLLYILNLGTGEIENTNKFEALIPHKIEHLYINTDTAETAIVIAIANNREYLIRDNEIVLVNKEETSLLDVLESEFKKIY